mmetsp:Transcript_25602/g.72476  ORF Transcript_25602/g.72476 Transcript_25602/m.72476 type:complete len:257 (+) Transcript_25602:367-1137(+)
MHDELHRVLSILYDSPASLQGRTRSKSGLAVVEGGFLCLVRLRVDGWLYVREGHLVNPTCKGKSLLVNPSVPFLYHVSLRSRPCNYRAWWNAAREWPWFPACHHGAGEACGELRLAQALTASPRPPTPSAKERPHESQLSARRTWARSSTSDAQGGRRDTIISRPLSDGGTTDGPGASSPYTNTVSPSRRAYSRRQKPTVRWLPPLEGSKIALVSCRAAEPSLVSRTAPRWTTTWPSSRKDSTWSSCTCTTSSPRR